mgnify:CR=1 FL=1
MKSSTRMARGERVLLIVAAVASILYFISAFSPQPEGPDVEAATSAQVRAYYEDNAASFQGNATMNSLAMAAVLVFTVCLARLIRRREPGSPLADIVVGGGVMIAAWQWLDMAINSMTVVQSLDGTKISDVSDSSLVTWYAMTNASHLWGDLAMVPIALVMGSASLAAIQMKLLPRWLGWAGLSCAVLGSLGLLSITAGAKTASTSTSPSVRGSPAAHVGHHRPMQSSFPSASGHRATSPRLSRS